MSAKDVDGMANSVDSDLGAVWPEVIKLLSCSTQLSMKFFLLINVKMPTVNV